MMLTRREAAAMLGVSLRTFEYHVQPHLTPMRIGACIRYQQEDIRQWVDHAMGRDSERSTGFGSCDSLTAQADKSIAAQVSPPRKKTALKRTPKGSGFSPEKSRSLSANDVTTGATVEVPKWRKVFARSKQRRKSG
jgi:predicted DNA-binding transcriptional regulator AlpA